ncbi:MAG: host attachment protein [Gemmatimonadetes bacterium]|nr:host attachment protein [Gemmatimonadota bacterium]
MRTLYLPMSVLIPKVVTRFVVADRAEARFYDSVGRKALRPTGRLSHPESRLHDRELKSDRPGRLFDRDSPAEHEASVFAHEVSSALGREHTAGTFDRLVLIAGPAFLGTLRGVLPKSLREAVVAEFPKDLVHESEQALRKRLPELLSR